MNSSEWLKQHARAWGITLDIDQLKQFEEYYEILIEKNKVMNLTGITEEKEVYGKHFLDSLSLCKVYPFLKDTRMMDIGGGAGFPSIPIKIAFPNVKVTVVDSLKKRISFLEEVVTKLSLQGIELIHGRAEDLGHRSVYRETFDITTARAVARLNVLVEYCLPFVKVGGVFIAMKGSRGEEEQLEANKAVSELGGKESSSALLTLPEEMGERTLVSISKRKSTPKKYPRQCPRKNPI